MGSVSKILGRKTTKKYAQISLGTEGYVLLEKKKVPIEIPTCSYAWDNLSKKNKDIIKGGRYVPVMV